MAARDDVLSRDGVVEGNIFVYHSLLEMCWRLGTALAIPGRGILSF
jgi:hypothetical protein